MYIKYIQSVYIFSGYDSKIDIFATAFCHRRYFVQSSVGPIYSNKFLVHVL